MSKVLVTGGAGFIGSHLAEALLQRGHRVVVLDNLTGGSVDHVPPSARLVIEDICEYGRIMDVLARDSFDYVYHLAASPTNSALHHARYLNYAENLLGSLNLISACIQTDVKCLVFASSTTVYGRSTAGLVREETTPPHPEDSYSIAKLAVEQELDLTQKMFGLDHVIFRLHHVCGARQRLEDAQDHPVGRFMTQALLRLPMTLADNGAQSVSFADVRNVATLIAEAPEIADARNQLFNIGADHTCSEWELAAAVAQAVGVEARMTSTPDPNERRALRISQEKLEAVFGERVKRDMTETLATLAAWARTQAIGQQRVFVVPAVWAMRQ